MRRYLFLFFSSIAVLAQAQTAENKSLEVGQFVRINACKNGQAEFVSMDVYARTKAYDKKKVDSLSGEGLLDVFFSDKSIDAKRLPCNMGGFKYKIAALHEFAIEGQNKRVMLLYTSYPLTLIWVELDKALELGEITFD